VYLAARLRAISGRYGLTTARAKQRVRRCLHSLECQGLQPTFATPGIVVERQPAFFRELDAAGAELAIHGYDHANFRRLSKAGAAWQFEKAIDAYAAHGIACEGFRCPYLSYTADVRAVLPAGEFLYSSNRAVAWPVVGDSGGAVFAQLARNYRADPAADVVCTPSLDGELVEIPASIPDDLQLCDGLGLGEDGLVRAWLAMLERSHAREELFAPLFHPEAYDLLEGAVETLLEAARARRPAVWLTQLRHVARWWRERAGFRATTTPEAGGVRVDLHCSPRATVLARGRGLGGAARPWDAGWSVLDDRVLHVPDSDRPFVGVTGADGATIAFLREQGYVVQEGPEAARCGLVLGAGDVERLGRGRGLVDHVEGSAAPLVRFSRWPDEAKSAFCFAGDLDALSLREYADRLRPAVRMRSGLGGVTARRSRTTASAG
jgi:hypothetical protein